MKIGVDLDGTLDRPAILEVVKALLVAGIETHIITGVFPEAIGWQDAAAKRKKMERLGVPFIEQRGGRHVLVTPEPGVVVLHILDAVPSTFDRDYRLADLGLRKGALCEELGIGLFIDDSSLYCEMVPKMSGATTVLQVR
jgi:hypothetical protein